MMGAFQYWGLRFLKILPSLASVSALVGLLFCIWDSPKPSTTVAFVLALWELMDFFWAKKNLRENTGRWRHSRWVGMGVALVWVGLENGISGDLGWLLMSLAGSLGYYFGVLVVQKPRESLVGQVFPEVELLNQDGKPRRIHDRPSVVLFFRGNWCAFCSTQLMELFEAREKFQKRGIELVVVANQNPLRFKELEDKFGDAFTYLSDPKMTLGEHFGIKDFGGAPLGVEFLGYGNEVFLPTVLLTSHGGEVVEYFDTSNLEVRVSPQVLMQRFDEHLARDFLENKIQERTAELEASSLQRRNLLRVLVHDIANSQMLIQAAAWKAAKALQEFPDLAQEECWGRVERALKLQQELVSTTRELEALSSGKREFRAEEVSLGDMARELKFLFEERLQEKGVTLRVLPQVTDAVILAERVSLLNQVLANLVSNAIKFTPEGGVVELGCQSVSGGYEVWIQDSGVGIPRSLLADLFDPSKPTNRAGTKGEKGTGFGMPLVKATVEHFGGRIRVESVEGQGTTCRMTFQGVQTQSKAA